MRYHGNFKDWVDPVWREKALESIGQARPRDWPPAFATEAAEYEKATVAGYDLSAINWWVIEEKDIGIKIVPPWIRNSYHWWITKMLPGQFMPVHTDPHTNHIKCKRYWMPLQDYESGHVFIYQDRLINNYKMGDLFSFINSFDLHGAANIGHSPRVMLMITEYE